MSGNRNSLDPGSGGSSSSSASDDNEREEDAQQAMDDAAMDADEASGQGDQTAQPRASSASSGARFDAGSTGESGGSQNDRERDAQQAMDDAAMDADEASGQGDQTTERRASSGSSGARFDAGSTGDGADDVTADESLLPSDEEISDATGDVVDELPEGFGEVSEGAAEGTRRTLDDTSEAIERGSQRATRKAGTSFASGVDQVTDVSDKATRKVENNNPLSDENLRSASNTVQTKIVDPVSSTAGDVGQATGRDLGTVGDALPSEVTGAVAGVVGGQQARAAAESLSEDDALSATGGAAGKRITESTTRGAVGLTDVPGAALGAKEAGRFVGEAASAADEGEFGKIVEVEDADVDVLSGGFAEQRIESGVRAGVRQAQKRPIRTAGSIAGGAIAGFGVGGIAVRSGKIASGARRLARTTKVKSRPGVGPGGFKFERDTDLDADEQLEVEVEKGKTVESRTVDDEGIPGVDRFDAEGNLISKGRGATREGDVDDIPGVRTRNRDKGQEDEIVAEVETDDFDEAQGAASTVDDVTDTTQRLGTRRTAASAAVGGSAAPMEGMSDPPQGGSQTTTPTPGASIDPGAITDDVRFDLGSTGATFAPGAASPSVPPGETQFNFDPEFDLPPIGVGATGGDTMTDTTQDDFSDTTTAADLVAGVDTTTQTGVGTTDDDRRRPRGEIDLDLPEGDEAGVGGGGEVFEKRFESAVASPEELLSGETMEDFTDEQ